MGRMKAIGVCLVAMLAIASVTAASASAEGPEFGRCLKQAGGKFKSGACTVASAPGEERFEWFPGVIKNKFTLVSKPETFVTLETVGGTKLVCSGGGHGTGEYAGPKTVGNVSLTLTGCEGSKFECHTKGAGATEVIFSPLEGEVGIIKKGETAAKNKPGLELFAPGGADWGDLECFPVPITIRVKGSLILPMPANSMKLSYAIKLACTKGVQKTQSFEGGPLATLEFDGGSGFERGCLIAVLILTNEEKVELSTVN
jgi:hypothetical protein